MGSGANRGRQNGRYDDQSAPPPSYKEAVLGLIPANQQKFNGTQGIY